MKSFLSFGNGLYAIQPFVLMRTAHCKDERMLIHAALVKNRSSSNDFPIQLIAWTKTVLIMISKLTEPEHATERVSRHEIGSGNHERRYFEACYTEP